MRRQSADRRPTILARWETQPDTLTVADGEAGRGVYAFYDHDRQLDHHYQAPDRRRVRFRLPEGTEIVDLRVRHHRTRIAAVAKELGASFKVTLRTMERAYWSITTYLERELPQCVAYLVPHITPSTRSVQVVVRNPSVIIEL